MKDNNNNEKNNKSVYVYINNGFIVFTMYMQPMSSYIYVAYHVSMNIYRIKYKVLNYIFMSQRDG